jgi:tRNA A-37 threonylcarbamoyl transferase component Bud32
MNYTEYRVADTHYRITTCGGLRWEVADGYRDVLLGPDGLRLAEWLAAGQAHVVKHRPHRTIYRVVLPEVDCYVKHDRVTDARAWLRGCARPPKARGEHARYLAAAARGVPTLTPLAVGAAAGFGPGDSFLVTRTLDAEPLGTFIEQALPALAPGRQARWRQRLAVALGRFVARLHDAGIAHHDLHANNLLVAGGDEDEPRLYLVDLHAVRLGAPLGWRASRDNLVLLNRWFVMRVGRADRLRFWRAYTTARWPDAGSAGRLRADERARDLEERTGRSNLRFWRGRDRRCLEANRYYRPVRSAVASGHAVADLDGADLAALLADPDEPFCRPGVILLKDSRSSTVAEFDLPISGTLRPVIYKRFRVTSPRDPWAALFRRTGALRSWVQGHGLRERCLPTPRPLLVLHRRRRGLPREGYLLTEKVTAAEELSRHVAGLGALPGGVSRPSLRGLIEQVARLVRDLHRRQLSHRDLKSANVLVQRTGAGVALWLIDLVGVTCHRALSRRRRVQNLARLHASFHCHPLLTRTDRLRFLRTYLEWGLAGKQGWKDWWHAVTRATQRKVAKNTRNGRPLA